MGGTARERACDRGLRHPDGRGGAVGDGRVGRVRARAADRGPRMARDRRRRAGGREGGHVRAHWRFFAVVLAALVVAGAAFGLLTDTPAEIRLREQLGLEAPCLAETKESPGWRAAPSLPGKRDELRAVALDGDIYLGGGTARLIEYGRPSPVAGGGGRARPAVGGPVLPPDPRGRRGVRTGA